MLLPYTAEAGGGCVLLAGHHVNGSLLAVVERVSRLSWLLRMRSFLGPVPTLEVEDKQGKGCNEQSGIIPINNTVIP